MKINRFVVITLIVILSNPLSAETGQAPDPAAVGRGLSIYNTHCLACHQENGVGQNIPFYLLKPGYIPPMPLNDTSHAWHHGDEQLMTIIGRGNQGMPAFGPILSSRQLRDIVAYIKSLWSPKMLACQGPKHMSCM